MAGYAPGVAGQMLHGSRTVTALLQKQALRTLVVFTNGSMLAQIRKGSLYNAKNAGRQKEIPFLIEMFRDYWYYKIKERDDLDNFELEAAMESGEFDAVMSEIKRIDDEAKKKGAYIFHPDKYLQYMKIVKLAKKIEEAEPEYKIEYNIGLPLMGAGITIRGCLLCFDEENKLYETLKEILNLADSFWVGAESENSTYIEITVIGVFTFHIDEDSARDILNGTPE